MTLRLLSARVARLVAATAALTALGGCASGPRQQPARTSSATTTDGKDFKDSPGRTSGPRQGSDSGMGKMNTSGPRQGS